MFKKPIIEPNEDLECPACEEPVPVRLEICPNCELTLH